MLLKVVCLYVLSCILRNIYANCRKILDKYGPKLVSIIGGILVGIGWMLAGFSSNLLLLTIGYGIIAGTGVGVAYGAPIAVSTKWFEDKEGL